MTSTKISLILHRVRPMRYSCLVRPAIRVFTALTDVFSRILSNIKIYMRLIDSYYFFLLISSFGSLCILTSDNIRVGKREREIIFPRYEYFCWISSGIYFKIITSVSSPENSAAVSCCLCGTASWFGIYTAIMSCTGKSIGVSNCVEF